MQAAQTSSIFLVSRLCHHTLEKADEDQTATAVHSASEPSPQPSILFDSQWIKSRWDAHCY